MTKVIGVRFRTAGKVYFFDPLSYEVKRGDNVIVETARGIEFGTVVSDIREVEDDQVVQPLKPVLRMAGERDKEQAKENKRKEKEAFRICVEKIRARGLEMKLIDAEYTFDNNKILFYFTADGRVDFRELVKDLACVFHTRIELRQVGVRDETKLKGGIGMCGRPYCCHGYLSDFIPVSIKMAKEQNLSLNPTKISGVCGRLMCCLKYEEDTYEELNRNLPRTGEFVTTLDGTKGSVHSVNVLRQLVKVMVEEGDNKEIREFPVAEVNFKRRHGKREEPQITPQEEAALESLAREEEAPHLEETSEPAGESIQEKPHHEKNVRKDKRDKNGYKNKRKDKDRPPYVKKEQAPLAQEEDAQLKQADAEASSKDGARAGGEKREYNKTHRNNRNGFRYRGNKNYRFRKDNQNSQNRQDNQHGEHQGGGEN